MNRIITFYLLIFVQTIGFSQKHVFNRPKLGSYFRIIISSSADSSKINSVIKRSYEIVDSLDHIFSDYVQDSECAFLSTAPANQWIKVSKPMYEVLREAQYACKISKGLFNVTIGKATKIWRNYKNQAQIVPEGLVEEVLKCVDCNNYKLSKKRKELIKSKDCYDFDFGGIAKGYIAQRVSIFLKKEGYYRHLIDAGGDLVLGKAPLGAQGWKIKKEGSQNDFLLENISVATSGSTYQHIDDANTYDTHIINPLEKSKSKSKHDDATIFHKSGMRADWMATWKYLKQRG